MAQSVLAAAREDGTEGVTGGKTFIPLFAEHLCHSRPYPAGSTEGFVFLTPSSNSSILLLNKATSLKGGLLL